MKRAAIFLTLAAMNSEVLAYNVETHAFYTNEAFIDSVLTTNAVELNLRLGFDRLDIKRPFEHAPPGDPIVPGCTSIATDARRDAYIDPTGAWLTSNPAPDTNNVKFRCAYDFEKASMPPKYSGKLPSPDATVGAFGFYRIEGWLMRGAIREDDFEFSAYENPNLRPDRDPWNDGFRSLYHFYNPITNTSGGLLTSSGMPWALGIPDSPTGNANIDNQTPDPSRGNHFSYLDARRNFFLALTYKRLGTSTFALTRQDSDVRINLMATTFHSLGHVVHLLQDFAQPQHVRSEPHNFLCRGLASYLNQDLATRTYENFINFRVIYPYEVATGNKTYDVGSGCEETKWRDFFRKTDQMPPASTGPWASSPYPIPQFSKQRKFFTTRVEDPNVVDRRGLADYTNRGFYTEDKFAGNFDSPPSTLDDPSFTIGGSDVFQVPGKGKVTVQQNYWAVPDRVAPGFADPNLQNGKAPIFSTSLWKRIRLGFPTTVQPKGYMTLKNYNQMADMLAPRAIAYSAGLINFFFRGKLEIEPITQRFFGVVDLGQPHTVNADGYPIITATNKILGFEKIRLKVRNLTDVITESGTNADVPQVVGMGKLVAVARYHRNPCYKPDLSGERRVAYAPAPAFGVITEPVCPMGLRTDFQEISVSAELPISAEADLPGGRGGTAPASLEKIFDFSADPIPVNATDLYIQVVYRGQLGEETDGIAVGNFDVQEPTFYAGWNNTDYYFNESLSQWLAPTATYPARVINGIRVCAGFPSKWVYYYNPSNPGPGLGFPLGAASPGVVRLAFVFAKPATTTQRYAIRSSPFVTTPPSIPERSGFTRGQERQASKEIFSVASPLPAPSYCQLTPPIAGTTFWCFDPIKNRRGQNFGDVAQPIHYSAGTSLTEFPDVDAAPAQQILPGLIVRTGGENKFNESVLADCPAPAFSPQERRFIELREEAWSLGIDPDAVGKQP